MEQPPLRSICCFILELCATVVLVDDIKSLLMPKKLLKVTILVHIRTYKLFTNVVICQVRNFLACTRMPMIFNWLMCMHTQQAHDKHLAASIREKPYMKGIYFSAASVDQCLWYSAADLKDAGPTLIVAVLPWK